MTSHLETSRGNAMRTAYIEISDGTHKANLYLQYNWRDFLSPRQWRAPPGYIGHRGRGEWKGGPTIDFFEVRPNLFTAQPTVMVMSLWGVPPGGLFQFPFQVGQSGPGAHFVPGLLIQSSPYVMNMTIPALTWTVMTVT
jgi:hypothetical protein